MYKILIAECKQEISTFNPVKTHYKDFSITRNDEFLSSHRGIESEVGGALEVFATRDDIELVPLWGAVANSSGSLVQPAFDRLAEEFVEILTANKKGADAFYFVLHGAMGCTEELDPEGYLLQAARTILGPDTPIAISLDLHGILTERMLENCDALTIYHTYPHVDLFSTGERTAQLLLRILDEGLKPTIARVVVPTLVRGDELKTATGIYGASINCAQELERSGQALTAGMMIGNPFTDVPELCSQAIVVTDNDPETAARAALAMAADFWPNRAKMQAPLVSIAEAIAGAKQLIGTAIFADAADATSSGASGDSNALLAALIAADYTGKVLLPLVDPPAVQRAIKVGLGQRATFSLGGACDPRFTPIELDAKVAMLATGPYFFESWGNEQDGGDTAVLQAENFTIIVTTLPVYLFDRSLFLAHGRDPRNFDLVVVKSPHCQDHFFVEWAAANFNIDAPGSTSANLKSLGHTICQRPMYPLDDDVTFEPVAQIFPRSRS